LKSGKTLIRLRNGCKWLQDTENGMQTPGCWPQKFLYSFFPKITLQMAIFLQYAEAMGGNWLMRWGL
jgi:hypothetical protein